MNDFDDEDEQDPAVSSSFTVEPVTVHYTYNIQGIAGLVVKGLIERLSGEVLDQVKEQYAEKLDKMIGERVQQVLDEAFAQPLFKTDQYGQRKGEPVSLPVYMIEAATAYLDAKVDQYGAPASYGCQSVTRLRHILDKTIESEIGGPVKDQIKKAVEEAKTRATSKVAELLTSAIAKLA